MMFTTVSSLFLGASAATLKVDWADCGDASTHVKITDLSPTTITTGSAQTLTSTGNLDEKVTGATFDLVAKAQGVKVASCSGDASSDVVCKLPLGTGTVTVKALDFPLEAGTINQRTEMKLSALIPAQFASATSHIELTADTGDKLMCIDVNTEKAFEEEEEPLQATGGTMKITWEDCGDASTHGHVTDLQPDELVIGTPTSLVSTGTLDEELTDGSFAIGVKAALGIDTTFTGKACEAKTFKIPLGLGSATWEGLACPVPAGQFTASVGISLSSIIPGGLTKADVTASATDQNGDKAMCVTSHLEPEKFHVSV